jgi:hypothetical protein
MPKILQHLIILVLSCGLIIDPATACAVVCPPQTRHLSPSVSPRMNQEALAPVSVLLHRAISKGSLHDLSQIMRSGAYESHLSWPERRRGRQWAMGMGGILAGVGFGAVVLRTIDVTPVFQGSWISSAWLLFGTVLLAPLTAVFMGWYVTGPLAEWLIHERGHLTEARRRGYQDAKIYDNKAYGDLTIISKSQNASLYGFPIKPIQDPAVMQAGPRASQKASRLTLGLAILSAAGFIFWPVPGFLQQIHIPPAWAHLAWLSLTTVFTQWTAASIIHSKADIRPLIRITYSAAQVDGRPLEYDLTMTAEAYQRGIFAELLQQIEFSKTPWRAILPVHGVRSADGVTITLRVKWIEENKKPDIEALLGFLKKNIKRVEGDERYARNALGENAQMAALYLEGDFTTAINQESGYTLSQSVLSLIMSNLAHAMTRDPKTQEEYMPELVSVETVAHPPSSDGNRSPQRLILMVRLPAVMTVNDLIASLFHRESRAGTPQDPLNISIRLHGFRPNVSESTVAAVSRKLQDFMTPIQARSGQSHLYSRILESYHLPEIHDQGIRDDVFMEKVMKALHIAADYLGYPDAKRREAARSIAEAQYRAVDGVPHIVYNAARLEIYMKRYSVRYPVDILAEAFGATLDRGPINVWLARRRDGTDKTKQAVIRQAREDIIARIRKEFPEEGDEIVDRLEKRSTYPIPSDDASPFPSARSYQALQVAKLWREGTPNDIASIFTFLEFRLHSDARENPAYTSNKLSEMARFYLPLIIRRSGVDPAYRDDVGKFLGFLVDEATREGIHLEPFYLQGEDKLVVNQELRENIQMFLEWMERQPHLKTGGDGQMDRFKKALRDLQHAAAPEDSPAAASLEEEYREWSSRKPQPTYVDFSRARMAGHEDPPLRAILDRCIAVTAFNVRTQQRILAHFLPGGHMNGTDPTQSGLKESRKRAYIERLLNGISGPDWDTALVSWDGPVSPDHYSSSYIHAEELRDFLARKGVVHMTMDQGAPQGATHKDVIFDERGVVHIYPVQATNENEQLTVTPLARTAIDLSGIKSTPSAGKGMPRAFNPTERSS